MADVKSIEKAIEQAADEIAAKKREMSADQLETAMYFAAQHQVHARARRHRPLEHLPEHLRAGHVLLEPSISPRPSRVGGFFHAGKPCSKGLQSIANKCSILQHITALLRYK